jgi:hypothetical protein
LEYYGIEYLNLNPNGIFHTSVFIHFLRSFLGDQAPLGTLPEVILREAPVERQRPPSSRRGRHPDARGRYGAIPGIQVDRLQP